MIETGRTMLVKAVEFEPDDAVGLLVGKTLAEVERRLILATLERCAGDRRHAAMMLDISERTIRNKLVEYGLKQTPAS
jgi:DNA-binding NtrC family response regulator